MARTLWGMEVSDVRRLKELEAENRRLKQMYAELSLKSMMQEEIIKKAIKTRPRTQELGS